MLAPWKESYGQPRQHIKKQRHYFANNSSGAQEIVSAGLCSLCRLQGRLFHAFILVSGVVGNPWSSWTCRWITLICFHFAWCSFCISFVCKDASHITSELPSPHQVWPHLNGCESWTIKKAEHRSINVFELWCQRRLLRVPWTARRSNQSILKEISPGCSLEGLMWKLKLQYFGHLMRRADSLEKTLMLGKIEGRRRRGWQRMR